MDHQQITSKFLNQLQDVHGSKGDRIKRRGGGGGFGYQRDKQLHKSKVYKPVHTKKQGGDRRQFTR